MTNQIIQVMNVFSPLYTLNLSPSSWVVLSSGPVLSRLSYFPARDINPSVTLHMFVFEFNTAFCRFSQFLSFYFCWSLSVMLV